MAFSGKEELYESDAQNVGFSLMHMLKRASAETLLKLIKSIEGRKDLVLDDELICSLDHMATFSDLKTCYVEKVFKLDPGSSPGQSPCCVYLVRATPKTTKCIADHINASIQSAKMRKYWIIFVPRKLYVCDLILEQEGVYGHVTLLEYPLGFIPLESDLFSLEITDFFPSFFLDGNQTWVYTAALALLQIQNLCGPIHNIYGQGRCAKMVIDLMKMIKEETKDESSDKKEISHLILIDRDVDYATVLLTQLTYEGLLDEAFGIKSGKASFGKEVTGKDQVVKVVLNNTDLVYKEIRNRYFTNVFDFLKEKAKHLQTKYDSRHSMSLGDMKNFVANELDELKKQHKSLALHISVCEVIWNQKSQGDYEEQLRTEHNLIDCVEVKQCINYIEETINRQLSLLGSLRLLCLLSVTQDGLHIKEYRSLMTQFIQSHGHKHLVTFSNLKRLGLFVEQTTSSLTVPAAASAARITGKLVAAVSALPRRSSFQAVGKKLCLIPPVDEGYNLKDPKDMGYIFSGAYIPVACKLTEHIIQKDSLQGLEEPMKLLPGSTFEISTKRNKSRGSISLGSSSQKFFPPKVVVLVYFLGGVTYAEVAALRLLSKLKGCTILIATTSIINGNSLLQLLTPDVP